MSKLNHPTKKLGKRAPRIDRHTLRLATYLTPQVPPPPLEAGYIDKVKRWPLFGNDVLGDCVPAASAHMIQQWTAYAGSEVVLSDHDVIHAYEKIGGYVPGDPSTDNGCNMLDALKYWRKCGFQGHKIRAYVSVDPWNRREMQQAMFLFGNLYCGLQLPLAAQDAPAKGPHGEPCWELAPEGPVGDASPGGWGGHCIAVIGFSDNRSERPGMMVVSWGELYAMTWRFQRAYTDELYAIVTDDWIAKSGKSPSGLDLKQLLIDLSAVTDDTKK